VHGRRVLERPGRGGRRVDRERGACSRAAVAHECHLLRDGLRECQQLADLVAVLTLAQAQRAVLGLQVDALPLALEQRGVRLAQRLLELRQLS
jgi:hypothetical protein